MSRHTIISALGVTQILAWGSSYYLPAVLAAPIARDTGWPLTWIVGGLSFGLLVAALVSPHVGRAIERSGGRPVLALGTPGSHGICQTQAQAMVQHIDFKLPLQEAIDAPRVRLFDGRRVQAEARIAAATLAGLRARGHDVETLEPWTMVVGGMQAIAVDPATGAMFGAADPRRDSYVATP